MEELKQLKKRLEFKDYPADWRVLNVSVDWAGEPLVLFEEGKPPQPSREAGLDALVHWLNIPARAHHLIHWSGRTITHTQFANSMQALVVSYAQPFGEGWLLGEGRGGRTCIFDKAGSKLLRTLDLGDASQDIRTTSAGHIWVSYFDEGVFGQGIGQNGLVCFDANGKDIFRYADFAEEHGLPHIADCYALNVSDDATWLCYYSDFPLVCLRDFQLERMWPEWGPTQAFAIRGRRVVSFPAYRKPYLLSRGLDDPAESIWKLIDPEGTDLSKLIENPPYDGRVSFSVAARGSRMYAWTDTALFELP
jgi:hypothetical protein